MPTAWADVRYLAMEQSNEMPWALIDCRYRADRFRLALEKIRDLPDDALASAAKHLAEEALEGRTDG